MYSEKTLELAHAYLLSHATVVLGSAIGLSSIFFITLPSQTAVAAALVFGTFGLVNYSSCIGKCKTIRAYFKSPDSVKSDELEKICETTPW